MQVEGYCVAVAFDDNFSNHLSGLTPCLQVDGYCVAVACDENNQNHLSGLTPCDDQSTSY